MSFFHRLLNSLTRSKDDHIAVAKPVQIKCPICGSATINRISMETISCECCGKEYTMDEASKTMGTVHCRDCIYHSINLFDIGIAERCAIWGLDECNENCNRKATKPPYYWSDENRWDRD